MVYVGAVMAVILGLFIFRLTLPGDLRLNRRYFGRYIKSPDGQGPAKTTLRKLDVILAPGLPEERVYYSLSAEFADGSRQQALVHVFYPLEVFHAEKEKSNRASQQEEANMSSMTTFTSPGSMSDMEKYREDPFKDLSEEERAKRNKQQELAAEVRQLQLLTAEASVYPEIIAFDTVRSILFAAPVGVTRLDSALLSMDSAQRKEVLSTAVADLAAFHNRGPALAGMLIPGNAHNEGTILTQSMMSVSAILRGKAEDGAEESEAMLAALKPLYEGAADILGPKMGEGSPRSFFLYEGKARSVEWARARRDISALDVVELICDPAVGLAADDEIDLFRHYVSCLDQDEETAGRSLSSVLRLAVYYRLILLALLLHYRNAWPGLSAESRSAFLLQKWPEDSLASAADRLSAYLSRDEALAPLHLLLAERLSQLAGA